MKKLEKTLTRDMSLLFVSIWHKALTADLEIWLGWGYSDSFYYCHDGYVDMLRSKKEHWVEFKNKVLNRIDRDRNWFFEEMKRFQIEIKNTSAFFVGLKKRLETSTLPVVNSLYQEYKEIFQKTAPPFIIVFWLPQWLEKIPNGKKKYVRELDLAVSIRKSTEFLFSGGDEVSNMFLSYVNKYLKMDHRLMRVLSEDEFLGFLQKRIRSDEKHLVARLSGFVFSNQGITLINGSKNSLTAFLRKSGFSYEAEEEISKVTEIRGMPACGGRRLGRIKVILSKVKIDEIKEGEILVSAMTTPEYLCAIKKAAAIVTDEGGIISHAAIVARELKKPCIIGTKIATKVLKDGDFVEVDADEGVVKILKHG